jgi:hypothetical protein
MPSTACRHAQGVLRVSSGCPQGFPFLLAAPVCSATKSRVLPCFMLPESSSLGRAVDGGSPQSTSSSRLGRVRFIGGARDTAFPVLVFAGPKDAAVCVLSAFSFASSSLRAISAEVSPAASASPCVFLPPSLLGGQSRASHRGVITLGHQI